MAFVSYLVYVSQHSDLDEPIYPPYRKSSAQTFLDT